MTVKLKKNGKRKKYQDASRELKNLWNMKVPVIPILPKDWYWDTRTWKWEEKVGPSRRQHYWDQPEYCEESWSLKDTCSHSESGEKLSANDGTKNPQMSKIKIIQRTRTNNNRQKLNLPNSGFVVPADHTVKLKECQRRIGTWILLEEWKNVEHESDGDTSCNWCSWCSHQMIGTRTGELGNKRMSVDHTNYCIIERDQNTEKSHGDLRRLAVTQTPVRNLRLTMD